MLLEVFGGLQNVGNVDVKLKGMHVYLYFHIHPLYKHLYHL